MVKVSIIIPNWNGRKLLEKNLPSVLVTQPDEIIVVDDASPDDSNEFLKKHYPQIRIVKHQKNLGFAAACNSGVKAAEGEIVILLNLDVVPEKDFLKYALPHFKNPEVFAVSFHEPTWSWARIFWKNGFVEHEPGPKRETAHISAWASGGSAAFRKSIWESLGGFDEIYRPFYWEDIDLGYRAWKRGWKILWEPKAIVHHQHEAIIGSHFTKNYIDFISRRNQLIFIWKNITDQKFLIQHVSGLLFRLRQLGYFKVILAATIKILQVVAKRWRESKKRRLSDQQVFDYFN